MTDETLFAPADLAAARERRASLHHTCLQLRELLASADAPSGADHGALARAVADLAERWERHIAATEAPDGLLNQILTDAPRLATMVDRFRREHPAITEQIVAARRQFDTPEAHPVGTERQLTSLVTVIDRHRRGGGELIYQAYTIDIGLSE